MAINENIQQHFRQSEIPFMQTASDWIERANNEYRPVLTEFLNGREIYLLQTLVNRYPNLKLATNGGYAGAEMKRGLIYPEYFEPQLSDFELSVLQIDYPIKFATIKHSQVLGTIMGSGIERSVLGDIITDGEQWEVIVEKTMESYLINSIDHIGRTKVKLVPIPADQILHVIDDSKVVNLTLPSLRMDVIIAAVFHISRNVAKELILHDKVRLNWFTYDKPDYDIAVHDLLSVRGYGRIRLIANNGFSKKDKYKVEFQVIKNK
ncbi:RNA-binding protein [Fructilactobacillus sp. Tb1]|uniref:YlmH family RNA-binding protein n=1 Tax=Fructilactobacillus sp. Tb1 TaxID=3422304 RepID=UPI003D27DCBA